MSSHGDSPDSTVKDPSPDEPNSRTNNPGTSRILNGEHSSGELATSTTQDGGSRCQSSLSNAGTDSSMSLPNSPRRSLDDSSSRSSNYVHDDQIPGPSRTTFHHQSDAGNSNQSLKRSIGKSVQQRQRYYSDQNEQQNVESQLSSHNSRMRRQSASQKLYPIAENPYIMSASSVPQQPPVESVSDTSPIGSEEDDGHRTVWMPSTRSMAVDDFSESELEGPVEYLQPVQPSTSSMQIPSTPASRNWTEQKAVKRNMQRPRFKVKDEMLKSREKTMDPDVGMADTAESARGPNVVVGGAASGSGDSVDSAINVGAGSARPAVPSTSNPPEEVVAPISDDRRIDETIEETLKKLKRVPPPAPIPTGIAEEAGLVPIDHGIDQQRKSMSPITNEQSYTSPVNSSPGNTTTSPSSVGTYGNPMEFDTALPAALSALAVAEDSLGDIMDQTGSHAMRRLAPPPPPPSAPAPDPMHSSNCTCEDCRGPQDGYPEELNPYRRKQLREKVYRQEKEWVLAHLNDHSSTPSERPTPLGTLATQEREVHYERYMEQQRLQIQQQAVIASRNAVEEEYMRIRMERLQRQQQGTSQSQSPTYGECTDENGEEDDDVMPIEDDEEEDNGDEGFPESEDVHSFLDPESQDVIDVRAAQMVNEAEQKKREWRAQNAELQRQIERHERERKLKLQLEKAQKEAGLEYQRMQQDKRVEEARQQFMRNQTNTKLPVQFLVQQHHLEIEEEMSETKATQRSSEETSSDSSGSRGSSDSPSPPPVKKPTPNILKRRQAKQSTVAEQSPPEVTEEKTQERPDPKPFIPSNREHMRELLEQLQDLQEVRQREEEKNARQQIKKKGATAGHLINTSLSFSMSLEEMQEKTKALKRSGARPSHPSEQDTIDFQSHALPISNQATPNKPISRRIVLTKRQTQPTSFQIPSNNVHSMSIPNQIPPSNARNVPNPSEIPPTHPQPVQIPSEIPPTHPQPVQIPSQIPPTHPQPVQVPSQITPTHPQPVQILSQIPPTHPQSVQIPSEIPPTHPQPALIPSHIPPCYARLMPISTQRPPNHAQLVPVPSQIPPGHVLLLPNSTQMPPRHVHPIPIPSQIPQSHAQPGPISNQIPPGQTYQPHPNQTTTTPVEGPQYTTLLPRRSIQPNLQPTPAQNAFPPFYDPYLLAQGQYQYVPNVMYPPMVHPHSLSLIQDPQMLPEDPPAQDLHQEDPQEEPVEAPKKRRKRAKKEKKAKTPPPPIPDPVLSESEKGLSVLEYIIQSNQKVGSMWRQPRNHKMPVPPVPSSQQTPADQPSIVTPASGAPPVRAQNDDQEPTSPDDSEPESASPSPPLPQYRPVPVAAAAILPQEQPTSMPVYVELRQELAAPQERTAPTPDRAVLPPQQPVPMPVRIDSPESSPDLDPIVAYRPLKARKPQLPPQEERSRLQVLPQNMSDDEDAEPAVELLHDPESDESESAFNNTDFVSASDTDFQPILKKANSTNPRNVRRRKEGKEDMIRRLQEQRELLAAARKEKERLFGEQSKKTQEKEKEPINLTSHPRLTQLLSTPSSDISRSLNYYLARVSPPPSSSQKPSFSSGDDQPVQQPTTAVAHSAPVPQPATSVSRPMPVTKPTTSFSRPVEPRPTPSDATESDLLDFKPFAVGPEAVEKEKQKKTNDESIENLMPWETLARVPSPGSTIGDIMDEEPLEPVDSDSENPEPAASTDIHAPATDANVSFLLNTIYAKSGHKPKNDIETVLKSSSMRMNHPIKILDREGKMHYVTPKRQLRKQDMKSLIFDPEEVTLEDGVFHPDKSVKKAIKKMTHRYRQKVARKKRRKLYEILGEEVPMGRPKNGEAELLALKMKVMEERQGIKLAQQDNQQTTAGTSAESRDATDQPADNIDNVNDPSSSPRAQEEFHFAIPVKRSDYESTSVEVQTFYQDAASRHMTPVEFAVNDGEGFVDEVEFLENDYAARSGFISPQESPTKCVGPTAERREEQIEERRNKERTAKEEDEVPEKPPKKTLRWHVKNGWRINKQGELVKRKQMGRPRVRPEETPQENWKRETRLETHRAIEPELYTASKKARKRKGRKRFPGGPGWLIGKRKYKSIADEVEEDAVVSDSGAALPEPIRRKRLSLAERTKIFRRKQKLLHQPEETIRDFYESKLSDESAFDVDEMTRSWEEEDEKREEWRIIKEKRDIEKAVRIARGEPPMEDERDGEFVEGPSISEETQHLFVHQDRDGDLADLLVPAGMSMRKTTYAEIMEKRGNQHPIFDKEKMSPEKQRELIKSNEDLIMLALYHITLYDIMASFREEYLIHFAEDFDNAEEKGRKLAQEYRLRYGPLHSTLSPLHKLAVTNLMTSFPADTTLYMWNVVAKKEETSELIILEYSIIANEKALDELNAIVYPKVEKNNEKKHTERDLLRRKNGRLVCLNGKDGKKKLEKTKRNKKKAGKKVRREEEENEQEKEDEEEEMQEEMMEDQRMEREEMEKEQRENQLIKLRVDDPIEEEQIEESEDREEEVQDNMDNMDIVIPPSANEPLPLVPLNSELPLQIAPYEKRYKWPKKMRAVDHPPVVVNEKWNIPPVLAPHPDHIDRMNPDHAAALVDNIRHREFEYDTWEGSAIQKHFTIDPLHYFVGEMKSRLKWAYARFMKKEVYDAKWNERNISTVSQYVREPQLIDFGRPTIDDMPWMKIVTPDEVKRARIDHDSDEDTENEEASLEENQWRVYKKMRLKSTKLVCEQARMGGIDYYFRAMKSQKALAKFAKTIAEIRCIIMRDYSSKLDDLLNLHQITIFSLHRTFEAARLKFERNVWKQCTMTFQLNKFYNMISCGRPLDANRVSGYSIAAINRLIGSIMIQLFNYSEARFFNEHNRRFHNPDYALLVNVINGIVMEHEQLFEMVMQKVRNLPIREEQMMEKYAYMVCTAESYYSELAEDRYDQLLPDYFHPTNVIWRCAKRLQHFLFIDTSTDRDLSLPRKDDASVLRVTFENVLPGEWVNEIIDEPSTFEADKIALNRECNAMMLASICEGCQEQIKDTRLIMDDVLSQIRKMATALEEYATTVEWPMVSIEPKLALGFSESEFTFILDMEKMLYDGATPHGRIFTPNKEMRTAALMAQQKCQSFFYRPPSPISFFGMFEYDDAGGLYRQGDDESNKQSKEFQLPPEVQRYDPTKTNKGLTFGQIWERDYFPDFEHKLDLPPQPDCTFTLLPDDEDIDYRMGHMYNKEYDAGCEDLGPDATVEDYKKILPEGCWHYIFDGNVALPDCLTFGIDNQVVFDIRESNTVPVAEGKTHIVTEPVRSTYEHWWMDKRSGKRKVSMYKPNIIEEHEKLYVADVSMEISRPEKIVPVEPEPEELEDGRHDRPREMQVINIDWLAYRESLPARRPYPKDVRDNKEVNIEKVLADSFFDLAEEPEEEWRARMEIEDELYPGLKEIKFELELGMTMLEWLKYANDTLDILPPSPKITYNRNLEIIAKRAYRGGNQDENYYQYEEYNSRNESSLALPGRKRPYDLTNIVDSPLKGILKNEFHEPINWRQSWFKLEKKLYVDEVAFKKGIDFEANRVREDLTHFVKPTHDPRVQYLPPTRVLDLDAFLPITKKKQDDKILEKSRVHPSQKPNDTEVQPYRYGHPGIVRKPTPAEIVELKEWKKQRINVKDTYI